jgi:hypothetical protein
VQHGSGNEDRHREGRSLLTEQVIPKLAVEADDGETVDERAVMEASDGAEGPAGDVPAAVTEAFEAAYRSLSADQAEALASLFTAVGHEIGDGAEQGEGDEEDDGSDPAEDVVDPTPARRRRVPRG